MKGPFGCPSGPACPACDGHHKKSDFGAVGDPVHGARRTRPPPHATHCWEATETQSDTESSMTIVAVNGGGNTPQGVELERCFVKSWSTSRDADGTNDSFIFADYKPTESLAVDPTNPNVD